MTSHQAAHLLVEQGEADLATVHLGRDVALSGARVTFQARPSDAAWISEKSIALSPEALLSVQAGLLVVPLSATGMPMREDMTVVPAERPKRAFGRLLARLLTHLVDPGWPSQGSRASDTVIHPSARIAPGVVLGSGVIIGSDVRIGPNTCLAHTTVGEGSEIGANCSIGLTGYGYERDADGTLERFPHVGRVVIGRNVSVGSNTCIDRGALGDTRIGDGVKIDNLVHVAHNVVVEKGALLIAHAMIGGSARIGAGSWVAPSSAILNQITLGEGTTVGMGAVVLKPTEAGQVVVGNPARPLSRK